MVKQEKKQASIDAVLKRSHANKAGEHPVKIRVTFNRIQKFYPVTVEGKPLYVKLADWESIESKNVRTNLKDKKRIIETVKASAISARESIKGFTFDRFEKEFLHAESKKGFIAMFDTYLNDLLSEGRIGTYKSYHNARSAFHKFRNGKDLSPEDITTKLLKDFEIHMLKPRYVLNRKKPLKAGKNTIAMYMRALKVIFNVAANENPYLKENYPFATKQNDRGKYKIRTGAGKKADALPLEDIQAFIATEPIEGTPEWKAKQIWLFSFYCQGMNMRDIALLQYQDVSFDAIRYVRRKTKDTESGEERMEVPLSDPIKEIILKISNPDKRPAAYVFDFIEKGMDAKKQDDTIRQAIKTCNKWLKRWCAESGLPRITTYTARHSYANLLKQTGESVELIRELLGHSDIRTTEAYLKRFDLSKKQKVNERIQSILKAS